MTDIVTDTLLSMEADQLFQDASAKCSTRKGLYLQGMLDGMAMAMRQTNNAGNVIGRYADELPKMETKPKETDDAKP